MNIPLDRLYHYIENIDEEIYGDRIVIYRFWPHGSKNINDLNNLHDFNGEWYTKVIFLSIWCNDQEPLDHKFYSTNNLQDLENSTVKSSPGWVNVLKSLNLFLPPKNLNYRQTIFEKNLLLHSEQRSDNVNRYKLDNELIPVYYWSHAIIARDWFRYAEHVEQKKQVNRTFLIYNRAWSNTREYRLKFSELLIRLGLQNYCKTSINPIEPELGIHYGTHKFKNPIWQPQLVLEDYFPTSSAHSGYSADFDIEDYESTDIEVVLETLFDDSRLHLTEKSLRPIACGQPFILTGTYGSLEYLRSYGFKTFSDIWDEQYDQIEDPEERLMRIVDLMRQIANWDPEVRKQKMEQARTIADYNRQYFFSREFFDQIVNELKTNLKLGFEEINQCNNYTKWISRHKEIISHPEAIEFLRTNQNIVLPTMSQVDFVMQLAQSKLTEKNS